MRIRTGRIVIAAVGSEVIAIAALVAIVAAFGPNDKAADQRFAEQVGLWFGPVSGIVLCFVGALWATRGLSSGHISNGALLGAVAASIDITLLILSSAPFRPIFIFSNIGRIAAGTFGGWLASRGTQGAT